MILLALRRRGVRVATSIVLALGFSYVTALSTGATSAAAQSLTVTPLMLARATSSSTLYVVGSVACSKSRCLHLFRTHDAVESTIDPLPTFTRVTMPPVRSIARRATGSLLGLEFATPLIGYALVGSSQPQALYATFDGAMTWQRVKIPSGDGIEGLVATGSHLYALFVNCVKSKKGCVDYQLDHSSLAARSWSGVTIPFSPSSDAYPSGAIGAYGENVFVSEQSRATPLLFTSHNGGVTFTKSSPAALGSIAGCGLSALNTRDLWAECPTGMLESFHFSDDAGRTWNTFVRKQYSPTGGGFFATAGYDFAYLDVGATSRNVYRINVSARREHAIGTFACREVNSAVFMSVFHAYAICETNGGRAMQLDRTIDGGVSWHPIRFVELATSVN